MLEGIWDESRRMLKIWLGRFWPVDQEKCDQGGMIIGNSICNDREMR